MFTKFVNSVADFFVEYGLIVSSVATLAFIAAWVYFVTIPNMHECVNHGFSQFFCLTNMN